jgi:quinol monooxygenase YgiN
MITRVVKLNFKANKVAIFLSIFNKHKELLVQSEGCISLDIFADNRNSNTYFTISKWKNEAYLEHYRNSTLFREIWSKVKPLFNNKAEAWTLSPTN